MRLLERSAGAGVEPRDYLEPARYVALEDIEFLRDVLAEILNGIAGLFSDIFAFAEQALTGYFPFVRCKEHSYGGAGGKAC